jgi:hypothetical protein
MDQSKSNRRHGIKLIKLNRIDVSNHITYVYLNYAQIRRYVYVANVSAHITMYIYRRYYDGTQRKK